MHASRPHPDPLPEGRAKHVGPSGLDPFIETFTPTLLSGLLNPGASRLHPVAIANLPG